MGRLAAGDRAPDFNLPDQDGAMVSLVKFKGKRLIVYFYPADDTPGCTKEACQFNDLLARFALLGVNVCGISPDPAESHRRFRERYGLSVSLLTDIDHSVMDAYGAYGEKNLYGRKSIGVIRSTFLVGTDGVLEEVWYNVRADGHAAKVLSLLEH